MSITCGKCKGTHASVSQVKACYGVKTIPAEAFKPAVLVKTVPESKYALVPEAGKISFFEVKRPSKGKWAGFTFVDRLVGHPGDFVRYPVKGAQKAAVLAQIAANPKGAAFLFSQEFKVCACCGSPLSDPESLATGFGPICVQRFTAA